MNPPLQYGVSIKREHPEEHHVPVKLEERPEERAPILVPKLESSNHGNIASNKPKKNQKGRKQSKDQQHANRVKNLEWNNNKLLQQLAAIRRKPPVSRIIELGNRIDLLERKLEREKAKSKETQRLLREAKERVSDITGLGRQTEDLVKVEDEDMESEQDAVRRTLRYEREDLKGFFCLR